MKFIHNFFVIILLFAGVTLGAAQEKSGLSASLSGKARDENGKNLAGVTVILRQGQTEVKTATTDKNGEVWSGGEYNDRILRLNPATGKFTEYLLPAHTNVRRVWVDNKTNPVTFWVGNNHGASIVKLEPLER